MAASTGSLPLNPPHRNRRRALLLSCLLLLLCVVGLWALPQEEAEEARAYTAPPGSEYDLYGVESLFLDAGGDPLYRVQAVSMHRQHGSSKIELRGFKLQNMHLGGAAWILEAPSAFIDERRRTMLLTGPVEMQYPMGQEVARIETENVQLQPDGQTAWTDSPARIEWGSLSISSQGFKADARAARLELSSQVRGRLQPPGAVPHGTATSSPRPADGP